jgi:hypothetical protein
MGNTAYLSPPLFYHTKKNKSKPENGTSLQDINWFYNMKRAFLDPVINVEGAFKKSIHMQLFGMVVW